MIDHLWFNKLKWFNIPDNSNAVSAYGKKWWPIPTQVEIPAGTTIYGAKYHTDSGVMHGSILKPIQLLNGITAKCIGTDADYYYIADDNDDILLVGDPKTTHYECWGYVDKSAVTPIWGGKLALLYARLKACLDALTKVVIAYGY